MGRKKVLITGAAGTVGTVLRKHLRDRYTFRLLFHERVPEVTSEEEKMIADIRDFDAMVEATRGVDAVVHLALVQSRGDSRIYRERLMIEANTVGTYNVYEAARLNGVHTVVFASTNHVTGYYEKEGIYTNPDMPVRPDSVYGAVKAFGESLARYYSDQYGMRMFCIRIGSCDGQDVPVLDPPSRLSRWVSPRDMAQLVWRCIETEDAQFGIFYGVSKNTGRPWDIRNAQDLVGYDPQDDGARFIH